MIVTKTPFRISFFGGGSDLPSYYNQSQGMVVSATIDKYLYISLNKKFDDSIRVSYSVTENVNNVDDLKHDIVKHTLKYFDISKGFTQVEVLQTAENQNFDFNKSAQECAQSVNDWWAQFPIDTVKIHLTAQKANLKPMADKMKQDKNFAAVIPLLKGNAATAWQLVSV